MGHNILSIALAVMVLVIITVWLVLVFVLMPLVKENKKYSKICRAASVMLSIFALTLSLCAFFLPNDKDTLEKNGEECESIELYIPEEVFYGR